MNGLLVVDKPGGITSRDALNRVQKWFPRKTRIGHTGTLDPLATGVLVVCIGTATRLADFVQAMGKSYDSRIRLGATSSTDDADGEVQLNESAEPPSLAMINEALSTFIGTIEQRPPSVSALKVDGHRAHDRVRKGESVELVARSVAIHAIRVSKYEWPHLDVSIDCGKGTYIRSIARDLGEKLGVGGMVETLRRTRVGPFRAEDGVSLEMTPQAVFAKLQPPIAAVADMPRMTISAADEARIRCGQALTMPDGVAQGSEVAMLNEQGELFGIALIDYGVRPRIVLAKRTPTR